MEGSKVVKLPHHEQEKLCETRAAYRQGRKLTAVKVYTINNESRHLIVAGVPKLRLRDEVKRLFHPYGNLKIVCALKEYPSDEFEEAFHVHYERIQSARIAKRFIDGKNFFGGSLHVFYAPELESLAETREKLAQRRKDVLVRIQNHQSDPVDPRIDPFIPAPLDQQNRKKKYPAFLQNGPVAGTSSQFLQAPYEETEPIIKSARIEQPELSATNNSVFGNKINYKGRKIMETRKKIFKPQIVDTRNLLPPKEDQMQDDPKQFVNVKKVDRGIKIKIVNETKVKRIVMTGSNVSTPLIRPSEDLESSIQKAKLQIRENMEKIVKSQNNK